MPEEKKPFKPTPHPFLPCPDRAQIAALLAKPDGIGELHGIYLRREELIRQERADPLRYGFEPVSWKRADELLGWKFFLEADRGTAVGRFMEILILGGNRAAKTEYMVKRAIQLLVKRDASRVLVLHENWDTSKRDHQTIAHKYLPPEWKSLPKGRITNIAYTQKNGFAENTFVLPNASQCFFAFYAQDINTVEGGEYDLVVVDELVPLAWLETLRFRIVTRAGELMVGFTPKAGYTPTVKQLLTGAKTVETRPAELLVRKNKLGVLEVENVPLIQHSRRDSACITYFHTDENPYGGYQNLKKILAGAPREVILMRAYGVPTRRMATMFPKFRVGVHTFARQHLPRRGTRYHVVDPCPGRSWFQIWALVVDAPIGKMIWIYREWPCPGHYIPGVGEPFEWTVPGDKEDGDRGPAQAVAGGFGLRRYVREIARLEGWPPEQQRELEREEEAPRRAQSRMPGGRTVRVPEYEERATERIRERWMDSRFGNAPTLREDQPITLIEAMGELGVDFTPAPGEHQDEGITMINDLLDFDEDRPIDPLNTPRLMIGEECQNLIYSLENWTGLDGKEGASKDPIDVLRYLVLSDAEDVREVFLNQNKPGKFA